MPALRFVWDDARIFLAVARCGTLTAAAERIGSGIATVSRRIERLEAALAVPLFARHQSGYRLTDEGEALLPKAEAVEKAAQAFGARADAAGDVAGRVRLATAENLANPLVIPSLPALRSRHPRLTIDIVTDVATVDLHRRDADLALRMVKPERGNVTVQRLGMLGFGLYGSPGYLADCRPDPDSALLDRHAFIGWSEAQGHLPAAQWIERALGGRAPALTATTLAGQLSAAGAGLGLAVLPHFLAAEAGLERMPMELGIDQTIWLVIHADLAASRRVRVVADHLVDIVRQHGARLAGWNRI